MMSMQKIVKCDGAGLDIMVRKGSSAKTGLRADLVLPTRVWNNASLLSAFCGLSILATLCFVLAPLHNRGGEPCAQELWESQRGRIDRPEKGNQVLPCGRIYDEMMPHAAIGIL